MGTRLIQGLALSVVLATSAIADDEGGRDDPDPFTSNVPSTLIIEESAASSSGNLTVPLILLLLVVAAVAAN